MLDLLFVDKRCSCPVYGTVEELSSRKTGLQRVDTIVEVSEENRSSTD